MARCFSIEYAIPGCCDGGAYAVTVSSRNDLVDCIAECAGLRDGGEYPAGADADTWHDSMESAFMSEARETANYLWGKSGGGDYIRLPWRDGFIIRVERLTASEALEMRRHEY
jgi:hypothetical protein